MSNQQFELKVGLVYKNNPFHNMVVLRLFAGSLIHYTLAAPPANSLFGTYENILGLSVQQLESNNIVLCIACVQTGACATYIM